MCTSIVHQQNVCLRVTGERDVQQNTTTQRVPLQIINMPLSTVANDKIEIRNTLSVTSATLRPSWSNNLNLFDSTTNENEPD